MNKIMSIKKIIFPNKKINILMICILFLGIIFGAIFINIITLNDKNIVFDKIKLFIDNINSNSLNSLDVFKNSLSINLLYILIMLILGISMVGVFFNIFLVFLKGFIFSFSISAFILTFGYKGIILSLLYLLFGQLFNILVILTGGIYSVMMGINLLKVIFKNNSILVKKDIKNYFLIFAILLVIGIFSSLMEAFILPALIKLIIKLFI